MKNELKSFLKKQLNNDSTNTNTNTNTNTVMGLDTLSGDKFSNF
jgi:acyl carrier protein